MMCDTLYGCTMHRSKYMCKMCSVHLTGTNVQYKLNKSILYTVHFTGYCVHYVLYVHCTLYTVQTRLNKSQN